MPTTEAKAQLIESYRTAEGDTGSPEVQVALITSRIKELTEHLKLHRKDFHSRLGLVKLVAKRKRLLAYLKRVDVERFLNLVKRLGIRH